jgi:hypothetical protein
MLSQDTIKSIDMKLAEIRSLVEQVDSDCLLYFIDMIVRETGAISSKIVSSECSREGSVGGPPRPPELRLVR